MASNLFLAFASGAAANVVTDAQWATLVAAGSTDGAGFVQGLAVSAQVNKALRQTTLMSAVLGQIIASDGFDANDSETVGDLQAALLASIYAGPYLTGVPRAPTATPLAGSLQIANALYADTQDALLAGGFLPGLVGSGSNQSFTVPAGITKCNIFAVAGGGGGGACNNDNANVALTTVSGSGGGSGAAGMFTLAVAAADVVSIATGAGAASQGAGGDTFISLNGSRIIQLHGGQGGEFISVATSPGGAGGAITIVEPSVLLYSLPLPGGWGSDGQSGSFIFAGNGAPGPWGGGGRAGSLSGQNATCWGAGGGGTYSALPNGVQYNGGAGLGGVAFYNLSP